MLVYLILEKVEQHLPVVHGITIPHHRDLASVVMVVQKDQYLNLVARVQLIFNRTIYFHQDEHERIKDLT